MTLNNLSVHRRDVIISSLLLLVFCVLFCSPRVEAAIRRGDANGDAVINIGDAVYIVNYIFKAGFAPEPLENGDANCDDDINIGDAVHIVNYVFKGGPAPCPSFTGAMTGYGTCKTFDAKDPIPPTQDCVVYSYDGQGVLSLTHVNASFNCCPEQLLADIVIEDNVITITEYETLENGGCDCMCLFDVDYEFVDIPPGDYTIRVVEYVSQWGDTLQSMVTLLPEVTEGQFCVEWGIYPWLDFSVDPVGTLTDSVGCHVYTKDALVDLVPPTQSCIEFSYDLSSGILTLWHRNAGFNCCPIAINVSTALDGNTLIVTEREQESMCSCMCLFDIEITVGNMVRGIYKIRLDEEYLNPNDPGLEFNLDLMEDIAGSICVDRAYYPWGDW